MRDLVNIYGASLEERHVLDSHVLHNLEEFLASFREWLGQSYGAHDVQVLAVIDLAIAKVRSHPAWSLPEDHGPDPPALPPAPPETVPPLVPGLGCPDC